MKTTFSTNTHSITHAVSTPRKSLFLKTKEDNREESPRPSKRRNSGPSMEQTPPRLPFLAAPIDMNVNGTVNHDNVRTPFMSLLKTPPPRPAPRPVLLVRPKFGGSFQQNSEQEKEHQKIFMPSFNDDAMMMTLSDAPLLGAANAFLPVAAAARLKPRHASSASSSSRLTRAAPRAAVVVAVDAATDADKAAAATLAALKIPSLVSMMSLSDDPDPDHATKKPRQDRLVPKTTNHGEGGNANANATDHHATEALIAAARAKAWHTTKAVPAPFVSTLKATRSCHALCA